MTIHHLTDYDREASNFANLPEYSIHCGTDYLAVRDVPGIINQLQSVQKILDLGCGSGLATRYLKKHFPEAQIIGADINKNMLEQAVVADPDGVYIHLQQSEDQILYPFLADYFDVVVCSFVVHENRTRKDLETFVSHITRIVRPAGLFLAWDVHENLFQGRWLNIENLTTHTPVKEGQQYTVKILPANAEVTGTYWMPETISKIVESFKYQSVNVRYPIAEQNADINWLDEIRLSPYFVLEAKK